MRRAVAIVSLIVVTFVGINLVISRGSLDLDPLAIGFTLVFGIIATPAGLIIALLYDLCFLQSTRDPAANGTERRLRVSLLAPIAFAGMAIVPLVLWRNHLIFAASWWVILSTMWAALCLYSLIMDPPQKWFKRPDRAPL